ncbi:MAG: flagellar hook-length control protein FliK [Anaerolineaceae bacterium]
MQNVVDVACSSPPVKMNATKPAAQAVQSGEQDPFDLVLQKASERIVSDKQSDGASKCSESKSIEKSNGSESSAPKKVTEKKLEGEAEKTNKAEKTIKQENTEISFLAENSVETEVDGETNAVIDPDSMIFGDVPPVVTVNDSASIDEANESETPVEIVDDAIRPTTLVQVSSTVEAKEEMEVAETKTTSEQSIVTAAKVTTENAKATQNTQDTQDTQVEPETQIAFSESVNKGAKVGEKTSTDLKPVTGDSNEKMSESGKVNVSTNTDSDGEEVISIARNYQEVAPKTVTATDKTVQSAEVETSPQAAPPDNPNGITAATTANATVQNTTQISEPARLAEAPKNEVITQVANQIDQMVKSNRSSVRLQLYPEELGHIDLRIVTTKNGIGVTMVTDKASTQQALKSDMESLRQSIEQAGIQQSFEHRQNFSNNSYPGSNPDNSNSTTEEPRVHLNSTVVDYRV